MILPVYAEQNTIPSFLQTRPEIAPFCFFTAKSFDANALRQEQLKEPLARINSFASLSKGWDGYEASVVNRDVIEFAKEVLFRLTAVPEVFPTLEGNIQFQFEDDEDNYLELELQSNNKITTYAEMIDSDPTENEMYMGDEGEWEKLIMLVNKFNINPQPKMSIQPIENVNPILKESLLKNFIPMKNYFGQSLLVAQV